MHILPPQLTLSPPTFLIPPHIPTHTLIINTTNQHPNYTTNQHPNYTIIKPISKDFYGEELSNFAAENPHINCTFKLSNLRKRGK